MSAKGLGEVLKKHIQRNMGNCVLLKEEESQSN